MTNQNIYNYVSNNNTQLAINIYLYRTKNFIVYYKVAPISIVTVSLSIYL